MFGKNNKTKIKYLLESVLAIELSVLLMQGQTSTHVALTAPNHSYLVQGLTQKLEYKTVFSKSCYPLEAYCFC